MKVRIFPVSIILGLSFLRVPGSLYAQATLSPAEQEVWQMELKLVAFSNAGNIEGFLGLFHEDHVGWSRNDPKPGTKEDRRKTLSALLRDGRLAHAIVNRELLSVRLYGDVAIVFYRENDARPDGSGKRVASSVRTIHTWKMTGDGWRLIGGMSTVETAASGIAVPHEAKENDPAKSKPASAELRAAFDELRHAMITNDLAGLDQLWADNYMMVNERGISSDKPQRMAALKSGQLRYVTIEHDDVQVRSVDDMGFLTWAGGGKVLRNGNQQDLPYTKCAGLWSKKSGHWQSEFVQCTVAPR